MSRPVRVLVVDDSATVRQAVAEILTQAGGFEVAVAADALIALGKLRAFAPDVILLDLTLPRLDGLSFLRRVMAERPTPIVICSGLSGDAATAGVRALDEGALAIVRKPSLGVRDFLHASADQLVETLRDAAQARVSIRPPRLEVVPRLSADAVIAAAPAGPAAPGAVVGLGASAGGTEALAAVLERLPERSPPIVIVQHMPEGFTAAFARRLDETCRIRVKEAAAGDRLEPGVALVARGNRHLTLRRVGLRLESILLDGPPVSRHRPSIDVLFRALAQQAGASAVGVLMTGMGDDGVEGLAEIRAAGGRTFAQDEASCVVYGMPKEAMARGAAERVVTLADMPALIASMAQR